jgi:hypothetical protein
MNTFNKLVITYLKWTSPIALVAAILSALGKSKGTLFDDIIGVVAILWILSLMYLVFALALQDQIRNRFVRWIAGMKENDERESLIAGTASKKTFIFMTGFIVLLIFLSIIRIDVYQNKNLDPNGKKSGEIYLGMGIKFIQGQSDDSPKDSAEEQRIYLIHYKEFPLAVDGVLIFVGLMQIGAFYYFSRKD